MAKERVKMRVAEGGHNIANDIIERRYFGGIKNLFNIYLPLADVALIFDNSLGKHHLIAKKTVDGQVDIIDHLKYNLLKHYYDND